MLRSTLTLLGAVGLLSRPAPAADEPAAAVKDQAPARLWSFWLTADEEYRLRAAVAPENSSDAQGSGPTDETDHNLRLFLSSGVRSPSEVFGVDLALGLWLDVDGEVPAGLGSPTDYRQPWWDVFTLTADYRGEAIQAKVGRQATSHGLPLSFDGAAVEFEVAGPAARLFAFGGRTTHFFETRQNLFEDWIGSFGLSSRPFRDLRLELDYRMNAENTEPDVNPGGEPKATLIDHSYGIQAWYRQSEWLQVRLQLRGVNHALSHAGGALRFTWPGLDLGADLNLNAQLVTLRELNERDDPYFALLGESLPALRFRAEVWKLFGTSIGNLGFHLGWTGRQVLEGEENTFNQSLNWLYFVAEIDDLIVRGVFLQCMVDGDFTHRGRTLTGDFAVSAGGAAGYRYKLLKAEVGTLFQRVKYDYYRDVKVTNDARTTYAEFAYTPVEWLRFRARYEYENSDRDFHTLKLLIGQTF